MSEHKLAADAAAKPEIFDALLQAANDPRGAKFAWCNETKYRARHRRDVRRRHPRLVSRAGRTVSARPDLPGDPHRPYSYAEAVDADGRVIRRGETSLAWGGGVALCTRDGKFELSDHKDCVARGLNSSGFAVMDISSQPSTIVRFKEP